MICCFFPRFLNVKFYESRLLFDGWDFFMLDCAFSDGLDAEALMDFCCASVCYNFYHVNFLSSSTDKKDSFTTVYLAGFPASELRLDPTIKVLNGPAVLLGLIKVYYLTCFLLLNIKDFLGWTSVRKTSVLYCFSSCYLDFRLNYLVKIRAKSPSMVSCFKGAVFLYSKFAFSSHILKIFMF